MQNPEIKIVNLVGRVLTCISVEKIGDRYRFSQDGYYHTEYPCDVIDNASEVGIITIARCVAVEFFKLNVDRAI